MEHQTTLNLLKSLDAVAGELETRGLVRLAAQLDAVANSFLGMKAEEQTEAYAEKYSALQDWVHMLHSSALRSGITNRLYRLLVGTAEHPMAFDLFKSSPAWKDFESWVDSKARETGKEIPLRYFRKGTPAGKYLWEDLKGLPEILEIRFEAEGPDGERMLDAYRQHKRKQMEGRISPARERAEALFRKPEAPAPELSPREKLEALFRKSASIALSPRLQHIDSLIRSLVYNLSR